MANRFLNDVTVDGKIGIGTTSPGTKLNIVSASSDDAALVVQDNARKVKIGRDSIKVTNLSDAASIMYLQGDGNHVVLPNAASRLGLGTTSPAAKLDVQGGGVIPIIANSTQDYLIGLYRSGTPEWYLKAFTNGNFALHENGVGDQFTIQAGGNATFTGDITVGGDLIVNGTTTTLNTTTVEVEDNILQLNTTQGTPDTATAATSGISVYRGDGVTQASLIFNDADDTWDLTNNLTVAGTGYYSSQLTVDGFTNNAGISFRNGFSPTNTGIRAKAIGTANRDGVELLGYNGIDLSVANGANVAMRILGGTGANAGNVGVGMTSPATRLAVAAPGSTSVVLGAHYSSTNTNRFFDVGISANDGYLKLRNSSAVATVHINSDGNSYFNGGNVGIGTNTPGAKLNLHVNSSTASGQYNSPGALLLSNQSGTGGVGGTILFGADLDSGSVPENVQASISSLNTASNSTGSYGDINFNTKNILTSTVLLPRMTIKANGNVGIGTTAPTQLLNVVNSNTGTWTAKFTNNSNHVYLSVNDANNWGIYAVGNTKNYIEGNVGIGTTAPGAKLDVASETPVIRITNTKTTLTTNDVVGGLEFFTKDASTGASRVLSAITSDTRIGSVTPEGNLIFKTSIGGSGAVAAVEKMRLTAYGGLSFGTAGTAYGTSGQVLTSNGNTSPTWQDAAGESYTPLAVTKNGSNQFPVVFANAENFSLSCAGTWSITATIASGDVGKTGTIIITNTATTTPGSLPSTFKTPNGDTVVFQTDNGDVSILSYLVVSTSIVLVNYVGNFS